MIREARRLWIPLLGLLILAGLCEPVSAEPVDQRKFYATVGATGGYALFKEKYGGELMGETIEKERWYGGAFGGVEAGLMWPVATRLDLGVRLGLDFGRLSTACESMACGMCLDDSQDDTLCDESSTSSMDCVCDYGNRFAVLGAATAVLAVPLAKWIWLEARLGLLLWVDGNTEPSMSLLWAGAVGFHLADFERVRLFLRLEIDGAWRIDSGQLGLLPRAAIGVRF